MTVINAFRDFADGLTRGVSRYFTERNDFIVRTTTPVVRTGSAKQR